VFWSSVFGVTLPSLVESDDDKGVRGLDSEASEDDIAVGDGSGIYICGMISSYVDNCIRCSVPVVGDVAEKYDRYSPRLPVDPLLTLDQEARSEKLGSRSIPASKWNIELEPSSKRDVTGAEFGKS